MAESEKERDNEIDMMEEYEGEENNGELSHSHMPNTYLAELNMLLVLLSILYFSSDECMEYEEREQMAKKEEVAVTKTCTSRLQSKRREKHDRKLGRRPCSSRFQTTVKDSRYASTHHFQNMIQI